MSDIKVSALQCSLFAVLITLVGILWPSVVGAVEPPELKWFDPPGGQIGTTVEVTAAGKFPEWPLMEWTESEELAIEVQPETGKLKFIIAPTTRPGVHWVRLYTQHGPSQLRPFVVDQVQEFSETIAASGLAADQLPCIVNGTLAKNDEVDVFPVTLKKDETLVASVMAKRVLGSPMDAVLQMYDPEHEVVLQQADDTPGLDPVLGFTAPRDGRYEVRVFAFPETATGTIGFAGGEDFRYRLTLSTQDVVMSVVPSLLGRTNSERPRVEGWQGLMDAEPRRNDCAPWSLGRQVFTLPGVPGWGESRAVHVSVYLEGEDSTGESPMRLNVPAAFAGCLGEAGDRDVVRWYGKKGETFRIEVRARELGYPTDAIVAIRDDTGKTLATNDDTSGGRDSQVDFPVPGDGDYTIEVRDLFNMGSAKHRYELMINPVVPQLQVKVASDIFQGVAGKPIEVPLIVTNEIGSDLHWSVGLTGLKYEVKYELVEVPAAEEGKPSSWKMVLEAKHPFQQKIEVSAFRFLPLQVDWVEQAAAAPGQDPSSFWLSVLPNEEATSE